MDIKEELSYSRIDYFKSCEYKYKLKYIDKNYTNDSSLALRIGSILHLGLELKYLEKHTYNEILDIVYNGFNDDGQLVLGINQLKEEYPFEWYETDKFGRDYDEKMQMYIRKLQEDIDKDWKCIGCEVEFHILFKDKVVIKGFIDRIDKNIHTNQLRVVDYKSSMKPYDKKDLATPMQMFIYALACKEMYGKYPDEFVYDMILIGEQQYAMTKGWEKRGIKSLDTKINALIWHNSIGNDKLKPKPSPLCYFCSYCTNNPNATNGKDLCEYYSLWTRENKTFKVNKEWVEQIDDGWGDIWN